jgi:hypothetical protein
VSLDIEKNRRNKMKKISPNCDNLPNPAKLMESLRHTGYDNYHAITDIIDNCIDAEANNIWVEIHHEKVDFIIKIIDDGSGMSEKTLDEALKLGSETLKDVTSDLGRFGMGLSTASLSMSRRTTVLTKEHGGKLLKAITDLDWMIEKNSFNKFQDQGDEEDKALFDDHLKDSSKGTSVILSKSDRIQNRNVTVFCNTLKNHIGRIFRRFIEAGKKFFVNGELVSLVDPLMLSEKGTLVFSDEYYPIKIETGNGVIEDSIRIRMVLLPDFGQAGNEDRKINIPAQGFYVMRNERELFDGDSLGVFNKDPHLNRFRAELCFSGALDSLMGVHFTKRSLSIDQALRDKIKEITRSQINQIRRMADEQRPSKEKEVSHSDSERLISKKSKLLLKPPSEELPDQKKDRIKEGKLEEEVESKDRKLTPTERLRLICKFEESRMDRVGPLYDPYMEGSKVVIRWNVDHPFYEKVLRIKKEDKTFLTSIDFLIYSLASAELKAKSDENISLLESIRSHMSTNLRVLLD